MSVLADELFIVLYLMIAGCLWWRPLGNAIPKKYGLAAFDFLTQRLEDEGVIRLHAAARVTLAGWVERLHLDVGDGFPEKVTAFRKGMAVHGRYQLPCPACGSPVQRIVHASTEVNYCATCQTNGRLLADRAMSKLLSDWPWTFEEWKERRLI